MLTCVGIIIALRTCVLRLISWALLTAVHRVQAATPTGRPDTFCVYFGGADTVIGSAVITISYQTGNYRPEPSKRLFRSEAVEAVIANYTARMVCGAVDALRSASVCVWCDFCLPVCICCSLVGR